MIAKIMTHIQTGWPLTAASASAMRRMKKPTRKSEQAAPPGDRRQMPLDECRGPQPGHLGQHLGAAWRHAADHADRHTLRDDGPRDDRRHADRRRLRQLGRAAQAVERMALPSRHHAGAAGCRRDRAHPFDLRHDHRDHPARDSGLPLHDRRVRRLQHPLRALCALRHQGAFDLCGRGAEGSPRLPARQPRHDRARREPRQGDVGRRRAGDACQAILSFAADRRPDHPDRRANRRDGGRDEGLRLCPAAEGGEESEEASSAPCAAPASLRRRSAGPSRRRRLARQCRARASCAPRAGGRPAA